MGHSRSSSPINPPSMISYKCSIATMGLSLTISEINGDFGRKSQNFPTALVFCTPLKGFPVEMGTGAGVKKLE